MSTSKSTNDNPNANTNAGSNDNGKRALIDDEAEDGFDFEVNEVVKPKSNSAKKHKGNVERIMTLVDNGVLFSLPGDDAFGHIPSNEAIPEQRCAVFVNMNKSIGLCLKTIDLNDQQPFVPPNAPHTIIIKAINMYNHEAEFLFPNSVNGCTIAVPAIAYSPKLLREVKQKFNGRIYVPVTETDVMSTIRYVKKSTGAENRYFVTDLASIYWMRETLEANNILAIVKMKKKEDVNFDRYALYLTADRFKILADICTFLEVRLALQT